MIVLSRSAASRAAEIARLRADGRAAINAATHAARKELITDIAGQDMVYREKELEAVKYLAASPEPVDLKPFPFLSAEAAARGISVYQLSQIVLFMADRWRDLGPKVEALRVSFGDAVDAAETPSEIDGLVADFKLAVGVGVKF